MCFDRACFINNSACSVRWIEIFATGAVLYIPWQGYYKGTVASRLKLILSSNRVFSVSDIQHDLQLNVLASCSYFWGHLQPGIWYNHRWFVDLPLRKSRHREGGTLSDLCERNRMYPRSVNIWYSENKERLDKPVVTASRITLLAVFYLPGHEPKTGLELEPGRCKQDEGS